MTDDFFDINFPGYAPLEVTLKNPDDFLSCPKIRAYGLPIFVKSD